MNLGRTLCNACLPAFCSVTDPNGRQSAHGAKGLRGVVQGDESEAIGRPGAFAEQAGSVRVLCDRPSSSALRESSHDPASVNTGRPLCECFWKRTITTTFDCPLEPHISTRSLIQVGLERIFGGVLSELSIFYDIEAPVEDVPKKLV